MRNNFFYNFFIFFLILNFNLSAEELEINSSKIKYDNNLKVTILEGNVNINDEKNNKLFSEYAEYNKLDQKIKTNGNTKIITSNGYQVISTNVIFDNKKKLISSDYKTQITDKTGNKILVDMFNYSTLTDIFFSKGKIEIFDVSDNNYSFSEIYIDENKKKIIGTDVRAYLNSDRIKLTGDNNPRIFANTMSLSENTNTLEKGVFTYCKIRENEKCPPWTLQSKKIKHDLAKKTIYYDDVVLKIYDFPIFYFPKFSHPDPTIKRSSGFLSPTLTNNNTMGSGFSLPYFWNIANDKDLTLTPKLHLNENPLMLAEYRQDFKNSFLTIDTGYTQGYKKKSNTKSSGGRAHFFSRFTKKFISENEKKSDLEVNLQKVSNDTYFKIYDIATSLVEKDQHVLENTVNFTYQNKDFYFGLTPSAYEDTTKFGNLRHEYLLPMDIEKNIMTSEKYGFLDVVSSFKIRNYETNKQTNFLINDFNWRSNKWLNKFGFENYLEGQIKAVNYDATKTDIYKNDKKVSELNSVLGYFSKLNLYKKDYQNKKFYTFTPKFLMRYAPGHMRKVKDGRLNYQNLFDLNKINSLDTIESGLSTSLGFDYKKNKLDKDNDIENEEFSFSAGQAIRSEENMDVPSSTSLDQRFSDVVGTTNYNINNNLNLNYNFSLDQSYKKFNYNEVAANYNFEKIKFNLSYLQERNHIGNKEFAETGLGFNLNKSTELSFSTKRNILTSSAEFYKLSYNYINDCLKAGIAYRREFYTDKDVEPANRLMFTISIVPFGSLNTPVK